MSAEFSSCIDPGIRFRPMRVTDTPAIMLVERAAYEFPWSEGIFRDCIRVGYLCHVVELDGVLAGYGILTVGAGEAHILNLCVRTELRRRGVGRRLLALLLEQAVSRGAHDVFLEVRPSNEVAIRLYESAGFAQIGVRRGYYQAREGREDALVYRRALGGEGQDV